MLSSIKSSYLNKGFSSKADNRIICVCIAKTSKWQMKNEILNEKCDLQYNKNETFHKSVPLGKTRN